MFPHERSLVERYQKAPFALLGVSLDSQRSLLQKTEEQEHINWRNWWDGDGQIAAEWRIDAMPTLYLIDPQGVIRFVHVGTPREKDLDREIDTLVREAGAAPGGKPVPVALQSR